MTQPVEWQPDADQPIIEAIQAGDRYALDEFVQRQQRWVRGIIFAAVGQTADVDDIAQKVWFKVWREAPKLSDPRRWRSWLYTITRNAATDALRSRQRRGRLLRQVAENMRQADPFTPAPDRQLADEERRRVVMDAIAELPVIYREPFVLRHLENWSYQEIGEVLNLPRDTVETRLVRARRQLREKLAKKM